MDFSLVPGTVLDSDTRLKIMLAVSLYNRDTQVGEIVVTYYAKILWSSHIKSTMGGNKKEISNQSQNDIVCSI